MIHRILIVTALVCSLAVASAAAAGGGDYLASRQKASGGFAEPGGPAAVSLTEWSVMGLAAAGRHPATMHRPGGHTPAHYLAGKARGWKDAFTIERGMLAAVAMGKNPRTFGGVDLVRRLRAKVASNGRIGSFLSSTYWGVLAFRAAGARLPNRSDDYIRGHQLSSGGFSYATGAGPDSADDHDGKHCFTFQVRGGNVFAGRGSISCSRIKQTTNLMLCPKQNAKIQGARRFVSERVRREIDFQLLRQLRDGWLRLARHLAQGEMDASQRNCRQKPG